jgi:hypothetical protein
MKQRGENVRSVQPGIIERIVRIHGPVSAMGYGFRKAVRSERIMVVLQIWIWNASKLK